MRYIEYPYPADAAEGQAFEELIFQTEKDGDILLLRIHPPAVVCGCYQNIYGEVDLPRVLADGVSAVRRLTGGGTVYHDRGNINYTLITDAVGGGADYDRMMAPMLAVLNDLGIPAQKNRLCDIAIGDTKISGSAQKIAGGRILHHGTLLYDSDLGKLREYLTVRGSYRSKAIASSPWQVGNLKALCRREESTAEFLQALSRAFLDRFGGETVLPDAAVMDRARTLAAEKYRSFAWTYAKSPTFEKTVTVEDITVRMKVEKGVITSIDAKGDGRFAELVGRSMTPEGLGEMFALLG